MKAQLKNKIYTVSELTYEIKGELESKFSYCQVQGEVSNCKKQSSGHIYFTLKDTEAQIRCVLFRSTAERLDVLPSDGDQMILFGQVTLYPPQGNYQILVLGCQKQGLGHLLLKLQELKKEILALGWLDPSQKKPLPMMPRRIGVVTSPTGAVIQDIINVLSRRFGNISLILNPVKVQGEGAKEEIAEAIKDFNRYDLADVLIVARGGGSLEDLWPFNEKIVAEAIHLSKIPVISAIGHETDTTLADLVSDVRAPTPSAAAELVIGEKEALFEKIESFKRQFTKHLSHTLEKARSRMEMMKKHPFFSNPFHLTGLLWQRLDEVREYFYTLPDQYFRQKREILVSIKKSFSHQNPQINLKKLKEKLLREKGLLAKQGSTMLRNLRSRSNLDKKKSELFLRLNQILSLKKESFAKLASHLKDIDPKNLLKKGYTILFSEIDHSIILSVKELKKNQKIIAQLSDGKIRANIEDVIQI